MATDEELKHAYKAFKKRIKLARLDDESGLSPGSKRSAIRGITPPAATRRGSGKSSSPRRSSSGKGAGRIRSPTSSELD